MQPELKRQAPANFAEDDADAVVLKMRGTIFLSFFQVEIYTDTAAGYITVETNGGNGNKGQNGAKGRKGADSLHKVNPKKKKNINDTNIIKCKCSWLRPSI